MDTWMVYMYVKIKEKIDKDVIDDNMIEDKINFEYK